MSFISEGTIIETSEGKALLLPDSDVRAMQTLLAAAHQHANEAGGRAVKAGDQGMARTYMGLSADLSVTSDKHFGKPL